MTGKPKPKLQPTQEGSGRPSKFTPERRASILNAISRRAPYEMAAEANGICEDTLYEWLRRGKQDLKLGIESDYAIFSEDLKRIDMEKALQHSDKIADNVDRWQADAWLLERRWHKYYSTNAGNIELNNKLDKLLDGDSKNGQESKEGQ